jgi:hypothetical protein
MTVHSWLVELTLNPVGSMQMTKFGKGIVSVSSSLIFNVKILDLVTWSEMRIIQVLCIAACLHTREESGCNINIFNSSCSLYECLTRSVDWHSLRFSNRTDSVNKVP